MIIVLCTLSMTISNNTVKYKIEKNDEREYIIIIFVKSVILEIEMYFLFYFQVMYFKIDIFMLINFLSITARSL